MNPRYAGTRCRFNQPLIISGILGFDVLLSRRCFSSSVESFLIIYLKIEDKTIDLKPLVSSAAAAAVVAAAAAISFWKPLLPKQFFLVA